jgi:hypothetical protein
MQVGLVGVARFRRDPGRGFACRKTVRRMIESNQLSRVLGRQTDLRSEPGPQTLAAPADLHRQLVDPYAASAVGNPIPGPCHLGVHRQLRLVAAGEQGVCQGETALPRPGLAELLPNPCCVPTSQFVQCDDRVVQLRRGHAQHGMRDRWGHTCLYTLDVFPLYPDRVGGEPSDKSSVLPPAAAVVDDERTVTPVENKRDGRMWDRPQIDPAGVPIAEPGHTDTPYLARPRRLRYVPYLHRVELTRGQSHRPMLRRLLPVVHDCGSRVTRTEAASERALSSVPN